jgi:hypothetical protein
VQQRRRHQWVAPARQTFLALGDCLELVNKTRPVLPDARGGITPAWVVRLTKAREHELEEVAAQHSMCGVKQVVFGLAWGIDGSHLSLIQLLGLVWAVKPPPCLAEQDPPCVDSQQGA